RIKVYEIDGFMIGTESFQPESYQQTLDQQINSKLSRLATEVESALNSRIDEEDLDQLIYEREVLEYFRIGLRVIQMEDRLPDISYDRIAGIINTIDSSFRSLLEQATVPTIPYYPNTFWWRK